MKILVAPNSFKECASSLEITKIIESHILQFINNAEIASLALTDGGDGFLDVCEELLDLSLISVPISKNGNFPLRNAPVGISKNYTTAYIESANMAGMKLLRHKSRCVKEISSAALGETIKYISEEFPDLQKIVIGIGGTATNDMGIGALNQLGVRCFDSKGREISTFKEMLNDMSKIEFEKIDLPELLFVTDVVNPLLGESGATRVFGPQKGVRKEDYKIFDDFFERIIHLSKRKIAPANLSGAGGGIPAGFQLFYDVNLINSFDFIREFLNLDQFKNSDYIITGEGIFDDSSLFGKATGIILNEFENSSKFVICWKNESKFTAKNLTFIELAKFYTSQEESIKNFREGIHLACEEIANEILFNQKVH